MSQTTTFAIEGMTCGHCALSVRESVEPLDGVTAVAVSVREGSLTLTSDGPLDRETVAEAVRDAGYAVAQ